MYIVAFEIWTNGHYVPMDYVNKRQSFVRAAHDQTQKTGFLVQQQITLSQHDMGLRNRVNSIKEVIRKEYLDTTHEYPWVVGYSGGKDSTVVLQLVIEVLRELPPVERRRHVFVVSNDTQVESPAISSHVNNNLVQLERAMVSLNLPVTVHRCYPNPDRTFWVNMIGRGYPAPNRQFRWCTDRLKIAPTSEFILGQVSKNGHVILLLGVRTDESSTRKQSVERHKTTVGCLQPHPSLQGALVFSPIVDMKTSEVWDLLLQRRPPWGGTHRDLVTLYRNAGGGECPLVMSKDDAPSCGTNSSRFGCWTCTVVEKDRSLEGLVESGLDYLEPLLDYRDWLYKTRNEPQYRQGVRRNGKSGLGPYTIEMRKEMLTRLLSLQSEVGFALISEQEVDRINEIWMEDQVISAHQIAAQFEFHSGDSL